MNKQPRTVIIGAGPAGIRAAETLVEYGLCPLVFDEAPRAGGQIYRQPPEPFQRSARQLYGFEAKPAAAVLKSFDHIAKQIDYRPETLVWNADASHLDIWRQQQQKAGRISWREIIIASGATDRILPFPGWTLPGVYSLGGAQVGLKYQGCAIGEKVVLAGSGPLLYLLAWQYKKAGVDVRAVLDYADMRQKLRALPGMSRAPKVMAKGLYFIAWLRSHGVALISNASIVDARGDDRVSALRWQSRGRPGKIEEIACDAVAFGYGLRSETQLADLLGCRFNYSEAQHAWLPEQQNGRTSQPNVYLAGDGAGILGAEAAELSGERAALLLLRQRNMAIDEQRLGELEKKLARLQRFAQGLDSAFPFPDEWAAKVPDDTVICRCEQITAGEIRRTAAETGCDEINQLKAFCRTGMGRCQGRMCGIAAAELLARIQGKTSQQVGRLRAQSPLKPIPITLQNREADDD
ncbi:NAD(P)/FAD-dependent oxidoreductase [Brenneria goodwinii]|uniref:Opine oxidase subunit A n=1 Tax=Brenneria goodwinii TaxID=1109412 RepID=A0A0G4JY96_9GAMM|nr:FAD/NAD(P)-binding oxidoreductase [Brenneria goodwinii]CPR18642.1 Opine oxidase subunit A [Brenneria goodwinii]